MNRLDRAKELLAAGNSSGAAAALRVALEGGLDYMGQLSAHRVLGKLANAPGLEPLRLAVLGSSTTAQLVPLLELQCFKEGFRADVYEGGFNTYQQEVLDRGSALYAFKPQVVILYLNYRDVQPGPAQAQAERWLSLVRTLQERAACAVILNNLDLPVERALGNLEARRTDRGIGRLRAVNLLLAERLAPGALLLDQEHLSAVLGKERWHDARFWHHSRQAMSFEALARYAAEAACLVKAALGRSRKCLVVDLDGTLWGGIVGEDGVEGLELGDTPRGEAFLDFQRYLKALKERGVLLAAASKNEESNAKEPFLKRPEMVLKLEDFAAFIADWKDKASNLRAIAAALSLGLDALAFADDSAEERELVRRFLPEVAVVDLPEDPADYVRRLDSLRLFEAASISGEDAARTAHFHAEKAREDLRRSAADLQSFLKDLEMSASAGPFAESDLERIVQLVNKTNQFNLTTPRMSEPQARALMEDPAVETLAVRLKDRLGDYGLVSAAFARQEGGELVIEAWLMSCRVLGRGVEKLVFNRLLEAARRRRAGAILGSYVPTAKNGLVKGLLPGLGFAEAGAGRWRLAVEGAGPLEVHIQDAGSRAQR